MAKTIATVADYIAEHIHEYDGAFNWFCDRAGKSLRTTDPERLMPIIEKAIDAYYLIQRTPGGCSHEYLLPKCWYELAYTQGIYDVYEMHFDEPRVGHFTVHIDRNATEAERRAEMAWLYAIAA